MKTKVLLLGIDGLVLSRALESGRARTLAGIKDKSFFTEWKVNVPTLSGPSWSTLLTGATYEQHRVKDNSFVGHDLLNRPDLLSRAFYQDQSTITYAAAGWPPLVDPLGHGPVIHQRKEQQLALKHFVIVRDGETYGYQIIDAEITDASVYSLENLGADVNFVYFCGIDEAGHAYGILGEEYLTAIERVDAHLERLHSAVKNGFLLWSQIMDIAMKVDMVGIPNKSVLHLLLHMESAAIILTGNQISNLTT
jgi:predicted AlkP superfamily pyrophosphatase or phosphodiesterase